MNHRTHLAALLVIGMTGTGVASAQAQAFVEVADTTAIPLINADANTLDDLDVYDATGRKIGEVEEVLGPNAETATAVSVDFNDNAAFGGEDRVVPLDNLKLDGVKLVLALDPAAVQALPAYDD